MDDLFYRAFEEKFRGPRDLIKSRLSVYLPFITPLLKFNTPASLVDLGCGRCEWLELVREHGFDAMGVDSNAAMLSDCRELGLSVHTGDAIEYLRTLPDASQAVVSGFHIVEHISFVAIQDLVSESLRVLKPAGLLILETPNPENLVVGSCSFYLDPTHQRPIPPQMLAFVLEFGGFKRSKILRLQHSENLIHSNAVSLLDVLNGVSPDYALVAQKEGPQAVFDSLNSAFSAEYGVTLESLANKYQKIAESSQSGWSVEMDRFLESTLQTQALLKETEARATRAEVLLTQLEARATQAEVRTTQAEARAMQAEAREAAVREQVQHAQALIEQAKFSAEQAEARATQAEARATQAEAREAAVRKQVQHAQALIEQAKFSAEQAEARATQAEDRAAEAAGRELEAREQAQQSLAFLSQAQALSGQAEVRATQAEARAAQAEAREAELHDQEQQILTLVQLAQTLAEQAEVRASEAVAHAASLEAQHAALTAQLTQTQEELHQVHQSNHHHWQQLEATRKELLDVHQSNHHHWQLANARQDQIQAILASISWRITAPLRWLGCYALSLTPSALTNRSKPLLQHAARYVERYPRAKRILLRVLHRHPSLERWLMRIVLLPVVETWNSQPSCPMGGAELAHLTPRARQIFIDLKAAIAWQH